jgi:hypothetical protein
VATGFLRNSMLNQEGGIEPEQFRVESMIDRMDAVGKAFLGLTIACAQCHDHKYDPILQKDYYRLFSFLNNDDEPFIEVPTAEQQKKRDELLGKERQLEDKARDPERQAKWEESIRDAAGDWTVLMPREWHNFATKYERQGDGSLLGGGDVKPGAVTHVWAETLLTNITGFRIEALIHPNLPYGGPGLVARGSFLLKEFTAETYALTNPTVTNKIKFRRAIADMEAPGFSVTNAIDGDTEKGGWTAATAPVRRNSEHRAVFETDEPIAGFPGGTVLKFTVYQKHSSGDGHRGKRRCRLDHVRRARQCLAPRQIRSANSGCGTGPGVERKCGFYAIHMHGKLGGGQYGRVQQHCGAGIDAAAGRHQREHRQLDVHEFGVRGGIHAAADAAGRPRRALGRSADEGAAVGRGERLGLLRRSEQD